MVMNLVALGNLGDNARIQTYPDSWQFSGSLSQVYKQIGNSVPVNLAHAMGRQLVKALNEYVVRKEIRCRNHRDLLGQT